MSTGDGILAALKILEIISNKNFKSSKLFDLYKKFPQIKKILLLKINYKKKIRKINKIFN